MDKRILLADDSLTIQKVVELTFMDEPFEITAVGSGDEAISRLEAELPTVVIADVHMPGPSGYEVCRRAKELAPDLPVLLLVGTFETLDEGELEACGADAHLKKPFDSQELLSRVLELSADVSPPTRVGEAEGLEQTAYSEESIDEPAAEASGESDRPKEAEVIGEAGGGASVVDELIDESLSAGFDLVGEEPPSVPEPHEDLSDIDLGFTAPDADSDATALDEDIATAEPEDGDESPEPAVADSETAGAVPIESAVVESEAAAETPAAAISLSDGDVERIARKAVELMADETVREVAWDVIPDMAEIVIKGRIRELEAEAE